MLVKYFTFLLFIFYTIHCYTNFTGIEICALYQNYPSSTNGNYGEKGVPSPLNYPGARTQVLSTYSKRTNTFWVFGGHGYGETGGMQITNFVYWNSYCWTFE